LELFSGAENLHPSLYSAGAIQPVLLLLLLLSKIGQHLAKLWARVGCPVFDSRGIFSFSLTVLFF